ncbi:glycosyltransferase family 2 protein [Arenibacter latericius]|uniref:glycosyltransferase family 2 protein n=1 Tax=Arenibacter latericius TaxID=86104 RepID=UPI00041EE900|nr:glycosyltransferase family 2 protein [Arenibacter latericius]
MSNQKVSILIPFKDTEAFLPFCIDSIINQTYPHWEVLAIDDHSSDNSAQIIKSYVQNDSRIQVHRNKGQGIIEALRTAYSMATGTFITRMDSDDLMASNKLKLMVKSLEINGKGHIALGKVKYFSGRKLGKGYKSYEKWLNKLTEIGSNYSEIYKECVIPSPCWMVHKTDLDLVGSFLPDRYPEDYDLAFRFYQHGIKCIPSNVILHFWRDYSQRTSRTHHHYAENNFIDIKLSYFLKLDRNNSRPLVIWGAGKKGKKIAKNLNKRKIEFIWICNNSNKIGNDIYGVTMQHYRTLNKLENAQIIITVANKEAQEFIRDYLSGLNKVSTKDYFFFC